MALAVSDLSVPALSLSRSLAPALSLSLGAAAVSQDSDPSAPLSSLSHLCAFSVSLSRRGRLYPVSKTQTQT
eukprot:1799663-Rhodomonas_salina.1